MGHQAHYAAPAGKACSPTFLFIGPGRAGSSWFAECLREHPDVFIPANRATFFFSQHHHMGVHWYARFFASAAERVAGEACEEYLSSPEALRRIRDYDPNMRLICCLRNPYERALSSWRFFGRNGLGEATLVAQAQRYPAVFEGGYYATQLKIAHSLFPSEQILTFLFEQIAAEPRSVMRRLYAFIGVDPEFVPTSLLRRINGNGRARLPALARLVHDIHARTWGTSRLASNAVGQLKRIRPLRSLVQTALYAQQRPWPRWRDALSEFPEQVITRYEQEINDLEEMLKRDLSAWRSKDSRAASPSDSAPQSSADNYRP
ncbi:MAG: sulfotransferase domain-containing protein [Proteobacteria bacterium]|nr:sulfotransferase domain-containing protein [Pseudomonadota bacterium]